MNTTDNTPEEPDEGSLPTDRRPLGGWLRLVDALITREFAAVFDGDEISRRDWMLLNAISGTVDVPWITARLAEGGKHLHRLADRGWITQDDQGAWTLTDAGREAYDGLKEKVDAVRAKVAGAVPDEQFAEVKDSLEAIARELGWDESQPMPPRGLRRGFGPGGRERAAGWGPFGLGHGFGGPGHEFGDRAGHRPGNGRDLWSERFEDADPRMEGCDPRAGFGRGHREYGFGPGRRGFGPGHHEHMHAEFEHRHHGADEHHGHGKRDRRRAERAYERGFTAGFAAASGRSAASTPSPAPTPTD